MRITSIHLSSITIKTKLIYNLNKKNIDKESK